MNRSIGIDISLTGTGLAALDKNGNLVMKRTVSTSPNKDRGYDMLLRLREIRDAVCSFVQEFGMIESDASGLPFICIEAPAFSSKTGMSVERGALNYMIQDRLRQMWCDYKLVAPTTLKKFITGKGNCEKSLILMQVFKEWGIECENDNEADAVGLSKIAYHVLKGDVGLKKHQIECLKLISK